MAQLSWSLDQPMLLGEREWVARVTRALAHLAKALKQHAEAMESPDGALTRLIDPSELPFMSRTTEVAQLRKQHEELHCQTKELSSRVCKALYMLPKRFHRSVPHLLLDEPQQYRAFKAMGTVARRARQLLCAVQEHRNHEDALLEAAPAPAASTTRQVG